MAAAQLLGPLHVVNQARAVHRGFHGDDAVDVGERQPAVGQRALDGLELQ
jgi:hypothetical protein